MKCSTVDAGSRRWKKNILPHFPSVASRWRRFLSGVKKEKTPAFDNKIQKIIFHMTSVLTAWFPQSGSWLLNTLIPPLVGHSFLVSEAFKKNVRIVKNIKQFRKILVISDIHIGDAVMMQGAVMAFRNFFPDAQIDYIVKKSVATLIEGNPAITRLYPLFTGTVFPTTGDIEAVQKLVKENNYDVCFNASSLFQDKWLFSKNQAILNFMTVAPQLIRDQKDHRGINHFQYLSYSFTENLLRAIGLPGPAGRFKGVPVTLSDDAVEKAQSFLDEKNVPLDKPILFLNPDTASPYTLIPFHYQVQILKEWLAMDCVILLGASFTHESMGRKLLETLSPEERGRVFPLPSTLPIESYAVLIDFSDVFLSGDTGPLHIAAARKVSRSGNFKFRNKTFVISVFGATPSRMSGYDSTHPLYPPANQDALSKTYVSESACRNITCVNKMVKTCEKVRCFDSLAVDRIMADVHLHLQNTEKISPAFCAAI
jgi:ADP-heptose:LPS heptosyltransferase